MDRTAKVPRRHLSIMLNEKERHKVLTFLSYFYTVGMFPFEVDVASWELRPGVQSIWKKLASTVSFGTFLVHTLFKNLSLLYTLAFLPQTPLYQVIIHSWLALGSAMLSFWYYVLFIQYPGISATFMRMTLTATPAGGEYLARLHSPRSQTN